MVEKCEFERANETRSVNEKRALADLKAIPKCHVCFEEKESERKSLTDKEGEREREREYVS